MPSKKILEAKQATVAALAEKLKNAAAGVLVKYEGITVEDDTKMRAALRAAGVEYSVIKNSITGRACDEVGYGAMKEHLHGMTALAISAEDPIAPAKILKEYVEKVDSFEFCAGFIDGAVVGVDTVKELADTPSKEILVSFRFSDSISKSSSARFSARSSPRCTVCASVCRRSSTRLAKAATMSLHRPWSQPLPQLRLPQKRKQTA